MALGEISAKDFAGLAISARSIAQLIGRPVKTVENWVLADGWPRAIATDQNTRFYPLGAALQWIVATSRPRYQSQKSEEELAQIAARTRLAEVRAAKITGELIPIDAAIQITSKQNALVRQSLDGLANRLAPRLAGVSDPNEISGIISSELNNALRGLDRSVRGLSREFLEAPSEADDRRVG